MTFMAKLKLSLKSQPSLSSYLHLMTISHNHFHRANLSNQFGGLHMTSSKDDYASYDQFTPNFDMACNTIQCVSVPNLKVFGLTKIELRAKEVEEFSIRLYGKIGWWAFFCPPTWLPQY